MPNYTWSVRDKSGKLVIQEIEAANADDAKYILLARGYAELELKEDDVAAAVQAGFSNTPKFLGEEIKVTAADRLKHRDKPSATFATAIFDGIKQTKGIFFLILILAVYNGYRGNWIAVFCSVGAALAWLAFFVCLASPLVYYNKMIQALDWYRWEEVLSLIETLKIAGRFSLAKVPETELIRNRANALAGLGRLDEALAEYSQCEGRADCPSWLYKLFVGGLYTIAKQYDKAVEYTLAAIAENPNSTAWLDLAYRYARYIKNPVKAREALAEADKTPLIDVAKPFRLRCLGVIAYIESDLASARRDLEAAIGIVEKAKGRPFRDGHLSIARAYLCCVLAKQGDLAAAKSNFNLAKEYLAATKEDELLAECQRLIGG